MDDVAARIWTDLIGRASGPLAMRIIVQPIMATLFATRDGVKDARGDRPAYLWTVFTSAEERRFLIRDGWKSVGKIAILAVVLDVIYQLIVYRRIFPFEAITVAAVLAILPYSLLRGPINRIARHWIHS